MLARFFAPGPPPGLVGPRQLPRRTGVSQVAGHISESGGRGARAGGASDESELAALDRYSRAVGLAFQVVDDILDGEASTATLGKTAGKDAAADKPTYVTILGRTRARELAEELRVEAQAALGVLGARGARLAALADFVVLRKF